MKDQSYKKTEKWWLGLVILFYALYNCPGVPPYGDAVTAIWHGALTLIPLWVISYVGMIKLNGQRKLCNNPIAQEKNAGGKQEGM